MRRGLAPRLLRPLVWHVFGWHVPLVYWVCKPSPSQVLAACACGARTQRAGAPGPEASPRTPCRACMRMRYCLHDRLGVQAPHAPGRRASSSHAATWLLLATRGCSASMSSAAEPGAPVCPSVQGTPVCPSAQLCGGRHAGGAAARQHQRPGRRVAAGASPAYASRPTRPCCACEIFNSAQLHLMPAAQGQAAGPAAARLLGRDMAARSGSTCSAACLCSARCASHTQQVGVACSRSHGGC